MTYYKLEGRQVVACKDLLDWAQSFEKSDYRRIDFTSHGKRTVSTVFLGINHAFGDGPPLLFETMVFTNGNSGDCHRCATYDEAEAMHKRVCAEVFGN